MSETPESIEVAPSVDNGNVPVDAPIAPNEPPKEPVAPAEPVAPTPELYELPDGRKVDAETVAQEYKNLLSDHTRKSQELARIKETINPLPDKPTDPLADPNYVPSTYAELIQIAQDKAVKAIEVKEQARIDERTNLENSVAQQLTEIKTLDPSVNENALFLHATKYRFQDLKLAHQNMKDMGQAIKDTKQATARDIQSRKDPVSIIPGAGTGGVPSHSDFSTARDFLRSIT